MWQDLRSNASIVMYMNAYEDPRRASYFSKSGYDGIYVGVRAGIQNVTPTDYATYSYPLFAEKGPRAGDVRFGKLVPARRGRSAGLDDGRHGRKSL